MSDKSSQLPVIHMGNVHEMSPFHLRQELIRRNKFDFASEDEVNPRSLLQRVIRALVEDQQVQEEDERRVLEEERGESLKDRLKREREERKREAVERSRQRQAERNYFSQKKAANEEGLRRGEIKEEVEEGEGEVEEGGEGKEEGGEGKEEGEEKDFDPFKLDKPMRVFVK